MKHVITIAAFAVILPACASTPPPAPEPQAPIVMSAPEPVAAKPAPEPAAVDCTGLSTAECDYQIQNYGNPNPPPMRGPLDIDPVPVEPVDIEEMGDIQG